MIADGSKFEIEAKMRSVKEGKTKNEITETKTKLTVEISQTDKTGFKTSCLLYRDETFEYLTSKVNFQKKISNLNFQLLEGSDMKKTKEIQNE